MPIDNVQDFLSVPQPDVENKLILPTARLYRQITFKLNALYQDIHNTLTNAQSIATENAERIYRHPLETAKAWYEQAADNGSALYNQANSQIHVLYRNIHEAAAGTHQSAAELALQICRHPGDVAAAWYQHAGSKGAALYAQVQTEVQPVYQYWQMTVIAGKDKTVQYLQAFWEHPEQTALAALEPVTRNAAAASEQAERYLKMLTDNPEQFGASMLAPLTAYLGSQTESAKAAVIGTYYTLADMASLLAAQPTQAAHALFNKTLSALLDVYFNAISSLLAAA